jgi:WD40 repeat protein
VHFPNTTTLQHTKQISSQVRLWKAKHKSDSDGVVTCAHVTRFEDSEDDVLSDIYAVGLQSNAEMFAAGSLSGFAHLVNVETGKRIARLDGHTAAVTGSCFCRQTSNMVVTSSNDTTVRSISFNKNHVSFFLTSNTVQVRLWDVLSGSCVQKIPHVAEITSVSSSGNYLLTSSSDNSHRIWDVRTFRFLSRLTGHENTSKKFVRAVFGTHETYVASGSQDGFVYVSLYL